VVADTDAEARALAVPNIQHMARLRTGQPLGPIDLVEDAAARPISDGEQRLVNAGLERGVIGTPEDTAKQITALADEFEVDEVMVNPVASVRRGTAPDTNPA